MKISEADAKTLLGAAGLPVAPGEVADGAAAARTIAERYFGGGAGRVVVKAQVLAGGRGKAGGV
ncbi:MAG TPA: ATP-grasp domain-containing protein, partial [Candidatus Limnocylindrales bacterium]|nr:ATP-grasp domain-containing protein [Candidatus Limnocylindrales bacterium]